MKQDPNLDSNWVYKTEDAEVPCLSEKSALDRFLQVLESAMQAEGKTGGVILTTIQEDEGLVYLIGAMKINGLLRKFLDLVAGFSHLENIFRKRNICKRVFNLKFLEKYFRTVRKDRSYKSLEEEPSRTLAEVGFSTLVHVLENDLNSAQFIQEYTYPIISGLYCTNLNI